LADHFGRYHHSTILRYRPSERSKFACDETFPILAIAGLLYDSHGVAHVYSVIEPSSFSPQNRAIAAMQIIKPLSIAAALCAAFPLLAQADVTVKIGQVSPLTGELSHIGKDDENGVRLAIEDLNARKMRIDGQPVTFVLDSQDDAADTKTAVTVAQKLVDDGVAGVVGHANSGTSIPTSKIYSDAGIPMITESATNPTLTAQGYKTITDEDAIRAMRTLAAGSDDDIPLVVGESGAAGFAGLDVLLQDAKLARAVGLDSRSRVLVLSTEGATARSVYLECVGETADSVLSRKAQWLVSKTR
jgi:hypothetical protein